MEVKEVLEKVKYYRKLSQVQTGAAKFNTRELYCITNKFVNKSSVKVKTAISTPEQQLRRWEDHFIELMGEACQTSAILTDHQQHRRLDINSNAPTKSGVWPC